MGFDRFDTERDLPVESKTLKETTGASGFSSGITDTKGFLVHCIREAAAAPPTRDFSGGIATLVVPDARVAVPFVSGRTCRVILN